MLSLSTILAVMAEDEAVRNNRLLCFLTAGMPAGAV